MPDNEVRSERFDVPDSPKKLTYRISKFLGADFTSSPSAVDENHSSNCVNMIRYMPGKIRKRTGYTPVVEGTGKVFAIWKWDNNNYLIHVGKHVYHIGRDLTGNLDFSVIEANVDTTYSQILKNSNNTAIEIQQKKYGYIRSGEEALIFGNGDIYFYKGDGKLYAASDYQLYTPTVTISKAPDGGGTSFEAFNLISPKFTESFYVSHEDAAEKDFYMSFTNLTSVDLVEKLNANGEWETVQSTEYSVDLTDGMISFTNAPGEAPAEGEDNVRITVSKSFNGYKDRIANCKFAIAYGIGGNYDRIFISGNPEYPNFDWFSDINDLTYFPDTGYSVLGSDASPINGYAIVSNYLVTLKGDGSDRQAAILRSGTLDSEGNAIFQVIKSLQGYPIVAPDSSIMAGIEPMFLTQEGIMAITDTDISGNQMMNSRSYYLDGKLLKEPDLDKAFAIRHGDYYMLFINSHVYILDTLQIIATANAPYSTRQYATFYWNNVPATCAASIDETIYFGTANGEIMKFYTDNGNYLSYHDNGEAIYCCYDTADIDALLFFKVKTYRYFALRVFPSITSSVRILALKDGVWDLLKEDSTTIRYFTFSKLKFSKITFSTDKGLKIVASKAKIKKMKHIRFRIENGELYEPLMIDQFGIEYTQAGNYKN